MPWTGTDVGRGHKKLLIALLDLIIVSKMTPQFIWKQFTVKVYRMSLSYQLQQERIRSTQE